jgi:hypothetical protein
MRARSWMAACALIAATSIAMGRAMPVQSPTPNEGQGQTQQPEPLKPRTPAAESKPPATPPQTVLLNIEIAGLGADGCDVEVKPGNASCRFRASRAAADANRPTARSKEGLLHVSSEGHAILELKDVELRGADRVCTVAIKVFEPGQPPKTVYRGFRMAPKPVTGPSVAASAVPSFTCYLSCPSKVAAIEQAHTRK